MIVLTQRRNEIAVDQELVASRTTVPLSAQELVAAVTGYFRLCPALEFESKEFRIQLRTTFHAREASLMESLPNCSQARLSYYDVLSALAALSFGAVHQNCYL